VARKGWRGEGMKWEVQFFLAAEVFSISSSSSSFLIALAP
jgi:hypothetical protein